MRIEHIKKYKLAILSTVATLLIFGLGVYIGRIGSHQTGGEVLNIENNDSSISSSTIDMAPFWAVWKTLDEKCVYTHKNAKVISEQDKVWGAIQGLTSAYGDPYTVFMP